jgi:putative hydrolase of the HAD superfamily
MRHRSLPASTEAVVFDWYGTLARPSRKDVWAQLPAMIVEAGGWVSYAALEEWDAGHPVAHRKHSTDEAAHRQWQRSRLVALLKRCRLEGAAADGVIAQIEAARSERSIELFDDVVGVLMDMSSDGFKLALCSNWEDWDLAAHVQRSQIADYFDVLLCSASFGYRKPHPTVFNSLCRDLGVKPSRIAFVGDSWRDDVEGARSAGMYAIHLARGTCDAPLHHSVPCVQSLRQLVSPPSDTDCSAP